MSTQWAGVVLTSPLVDAFVAEGVQAGFQGHLNLCAEADFTQVTVFFIIVVWEATSVGGLLFAFVVFKLHLFGLFFYYVVGLVWFVSFYGYFGCFK